MNRVIGIQGWRGSHGKKVTRSNIHYDECPARDRPINVQFAFCPALKLDIDRQNDVLAGFGWLPDIVCLTVTYVVHNH